MQVSLRDVPAQDAINKMAERLRSEGLVQPPAWVGTVKTGVDRERVPADPNFYFVRAASVLRTVYLSGPVGVQRLRRKYGGKRRHKVRSPHHRKAGGKTIRLVLQQLEQAGLIERKAKTSGRTITPKGAKFVDACARGVSQ